MALSTSRARIIVTGYLAQYPLGGVTWDYLQYVLGLWRMGHDVYYIEDTGQWPYSPASASGSGGLAKECQFNVDYLASLMDRFGLAERWAYRFPWQDQWFGMADDKRREVVASADLLLNVSGTLEHPDHYRSARVLAYIDSDPTFTQVKIAGNNRYFRQLIEQHDVLFSFGEALGGNDHATPQTGHEWLPTRQPIVRDEWERLPECRPVYTTVMNWSAHKPLALGSRTFGQKDVEFDRFMDLPRRVGDVRFELAAGQGKERKLPLELLRHHGWHVIDPAVACPDLDSYRQYVRHSRAEWSVAKHGYVEGRSGWFSCRSACYLAAGRPVVVQDTGFGQVLPVGCGLLSFRDSDQAVAAIAAVEADYDSHAAAARDIAATWFDSNIVLASLLGRCL